MKKIIEINNSIFVNMHYKSLAAKCRDKKSILYVPGHENNFVFY